MSLILLSPRWKNSVLFVNVEKGNFVVVVDNEDRENEGDLIISGEDFTPEKAAFMIRYTR